MKYKVGDIVRLRPWSDFDNHDGISAIYWTELINEDLKIYHIQKNNGKIYYNLEGKLFAYAEKFLIPSSYVNYFSDKDFEL